VVGCDYEPSSGGEPMHQGPEGVTPQLLCHLAGKRSAWVLLGAANRDPLRFPNPSEFDPERPENRHFGWGSGIRYPLTALAEIPH
jgi:hypothetical protein